MNSDLFLAILAMDSYNRGYAPSVRGLPTASIGTATITGESNVDANSAARLSGFYAVRYQWGNKTVLSYRGTDEFQSDVLNGYPTALGGMSVQSRLAHEFYFEMIGSTATRVANPEVWVTGHSLGAGLAGHTAALYGSNAVLFDAMPFQMGADATMEAAKAAHLSTGVSALYPDDNPFNRSVDLGGIRHIYIPTASYRPWTNILDTIRPDPNLPGSAYTLPDGAELGWTSRNKVGQRHSNNLLVIRMFGGDPDLSGADWEPSAKYWMKALFNEDVARAAGALEFDATDGNDMSNAMSAAIAYSAIDEGTRVFGDTGIRSMYDDAADLGRALKAPNASSSIVRAGQSLGDILVQYAGKLALGKVLQSGDSAALAGVLANNGEVLSVDFGDALWAKGQDHDGEILGRRTLITDALSELYVRTGIFGQGPPELRSDLVAGMRWFAANNGLTVEHAADLIDRVSFRISNGSFDGAVPERPSGAPSNRLSLFVSADGKDLITGSAENDFIYGGKGDDSIVGGAGDDILAGGEGHDILVGGIGRDFLAGGEGDDRIDLGLQLREEGVELSVKAVDPAAPTDRATFELTFEGDTDRAVSIERIDLTAHSDTVQISYLGSPDGSEQPMGALKINFLGSPVELNVDLLDFSGAGVANAWDSTPAGIKVDLSDATDQTVEYYYVLAELPTGHQLTWTQSDVQLRAASANAVKGTQYADWLIGNGGRWEDGEGFSTLYGQGGNDTLQGAGRETHMFGGEGSDTFKIGANSWVEDAESHDRVTYAGFTIFGGAKQWWMEGGTAAWMPFSTVMSGFPVIGSQILTAAAFFVDVATMKFASFQRDASGDLVMVLGWGHGGFGIIKDYHLDLDSGVASAGVTIFQAESADSFSPGNLPKFINLALYAGFGRGLPGFDPLVLDLDGDGFELTSEGNSKVYFEFDGDGFGERTGWVRGDDGLLARDANGNGRIDDVTELFGNRTQSGFAALGAFDLNADGAIDAQDAVYSELRVWRDADQDGVTDAGELKTMAELGIVSISLASTAPAQATAIGGNQILRTGFFTRADGTSGAVGDVAFSISETSTRWLGDTAVSASAAALPQLRGFGEMKDLRLAMTGDAALEALVSAFAANPTNDLAVLKADAESILYAWAGVSGVAATTIGTGGFDARKLAFLEKYAGQALMPRDADGAVLTTNVEEMQALWADQLTRLTLRLVVQGPLAEEFAGLGYRADLDLLVADTPSALKDLYGRILADLAADPAAALAQWQAWAPLLGAMADGMRRFDANIVRSDYVAAQLLAAADGAAQPLSYAQLAGALGIGELRIGTAGGETLARGSASGTVIHAGQGGNDRFDGGAGQDVYIFGRQIGHSVIDDEEARASGDRIRFAFLNPGDVTLERSGHDLLITVKATGETVRVIGQFAPVVPLAADVFLSSNKGVEDIQFADGTVWEIPEIMTAVGTGTDGNDHIVGTMHSDVLIGGLGNDRLEGGDDADLYVVRAGDGQDVIRDAQTNPLLRAADLLIFGDGIAPSDLVFSRAGAAGNDLLITIGTSGQSLLVEGQFSYLVLGYNDRFAPNSRIEAFGFKNYGESWSSRDVQQMMIGEATTAGNDTALGFGDDDEFGASAGNDLMIGMDGADRYLWGKGSGHDIIDERARFIDVKVGMMGLSLVDEADTVRFLAGVVRSDVVFSRPTEAPDLLVTILSTGETLLVKNQFDGFQTGPFGAQWLDRIEWFEFADGTKVSWKQVLLETTTGGSGNDRLWGDLYQDRLEGGPGNDTLSGRGYGDTYVYNVGDGNDTIVDSNTSILGAGILQLDFDPDVLRFGPRITPQQIGFERSGMDITLVVGTTGGRVTLKGQDDYFHTGVFGPHSTDRIEEVRFDDGTSWTWQDINRLAIAAATTAGNDYTQGFTMADRFEASAGNDILAGADSGDTYVFGPGSGHDIIRESVSNVLYGNEDAVEFAPGVLPSDVAVSRVGDDLVLSLASGDTLTIDGQFDYQNWFEWWDVELFKFENGTVWTKESIQLELLRPTSGNDHLLGFVSDDDLDGGAGNDHLEGGDGSDTYRFGYGSGHDMINEWVSNANLANNDRLVFAPNVAPGNVAFSREGDDLVMTLAGSGETVRVQGHFSFMSWFAWRDVESFEFADGTVLTDRDVANIIMGGTPGNDHILGTFRADTLDGGAGSDILEGADGDDRYVFGRGYGQDKIRESLSNANLGENDQLQFLPGIFLADLAFSRSGNDLLISIAGTADSLLIHDQFRYSNWFTWWDIDRFVFADDTTLSAQDVQQILLAPTAGDDQMLGFMTGDLLDGGAGNDVLQGGDGSDTYVFGCGYGNDRIVEWVGNANLDNQDVLRFLPGITLDDLKFVRQDKDLLITIAGTSDSVLIQDQFRYSNWYQWWDVESFVLADGTTLTVLDVQRILLTPTAGNDHIFGFMTDDVIDGGAGDDLLEGADGADTYLFGRGSGQDVVKEWLGNANIADTDTILFGPGVAWSDLRFSRSADTLIIGIAGTTDTIRVTNQWLTINDRSSATWQDVENFVFADGTRKTVDDIQIELLKSTDGNDHLIGFFTPDTLAGGKGDDYLEGYRGDDRYIHNRLDGQDTIRDYTLARSNSGDRLVFGAGIAPGDVTVRRSSTNAADMVLSVHGGESSVTLVGQITGGGEYTIDFVEFAGGVVWTKETLANLLTSGAATPGDDAIDGTTLSDQIHGGAGNDVIKGLGGADTLDGGLGNDRLEGAEGNDTYVYHAGGGDDVVSEYVISWGSSDTIDLRGVALADLRVTRTGSDFNDMVLTFANAAGSIVIDNQFTSGAWGVDSLLIDDAALSALDLSALYFAGTMTEGADTIQGGWLDESIRGGGGDDVLKGMGGADVLEGGAGNDRLEGAEGNDIYVWQPGDGDDTVGDYVITWGSYNTVQIGGGLTAADLLVRRSAADGNDLVLSFAGVPGSVTIDNQWLDDDWGISLVKFASGPNLTAADLNNLYFSQMATAADDVIGGAYFNDAINGLGGNDTLRGWGGSDVLDGGAGNDRLEGEAGDDVYLYALGGGDDLVYEYVYWNGSFNTLRFGQGITPLGLRLVPGALDPSDLVISFAEAAGSVTVDNQNLGGHEWGVDEIRFFDGTVWSAGKIVAEYAARQGTDAGELVSGTHWNETLNGRGGNDTIRSYKGDDVLIGGTGNDRLEGGEGADIYRYSAGDGDDVILDVGGTRTNRLVFGAGILPEDVLFSRSPQDPSDLRISFKSMAGSILIDNETASDAGVEFIEFADGTVLSGAALAARIGPGSGGADIIAGTAAADDLWALEGNDTVSGRDGNDRIVGGSGNDVLIGDTRINIGSNLVSNGSFETLGGTVVTHSWGGTTATSLPGWTKTNSSVYELIHSNPNGAVADGKYVLDMEGQGSQSNMNISQTIAGRTAGELLELKFDAANFTTVASGSFDVLWNGVVVATYALEGKSMRGFSLLLTAVAGNNVLGFRGTGTIDNSGAALDNVRLYATTGGGLGDDLLIGGTGDDRLLGGPGNDSYSFARGDGSDTILELAEEGADRLVFAAGISPADVSFDLSADGADVILLIAGGSDRITFPGAAGAGSIGVEEFSFDDGTVWDQAAIASRVPHYTTGADAISGSAAANTLHGGGGNDQLSGLAGHDALYGGDGDDRLTGGDGNDRLFGGAGTDVAVFAGLQASYTLVTSGGSIQVIDNDAAADGNDGTDTLAGVELAEFKGGVQTGLAAPIVLDLDGDGLDLVGLSRSRARFDWNGDGRLDRTGWIGKEDGLLVYDRDGNGKVSGAHELSFLNDLPGARSDLDGLRAFDSNGDGIFSALDDAWSRFRVWKDKDRDGVEDKGELLTMAKAGVASISLEAAPTEQSWIWGENLIVNNGHFTRVDGTTSALGDVAMAYAPSAARAVSAPSRHDSSPLDYWFQGMRSPFPELLPLIEGRPFEPALPIDLLG